MHNSFNIWIWFEQMSSTYLCIYLSQSSSALQQFSSLHFVFSRSSFSSVCLLLSVWVCLPTLQGQDPAGISALSWMHLVQLSTCALTAEFASLGGDERFCSGEAEDSDSWDLPSVEFLNNGLFNWQPQKDFVNSTSHTYTVNKLTKLNLHLWVLNLSQMNHDSIYQVSIINSYLLGAKTSHVQLESLKVNEHLMCFYSCGNIYLFDCCEKHPHTNQLGLTNWLDQVIESTIIHQVNGHLKSKELCHKWSESKANLYFFDCLIQDFMC